MKELDIEKRRTDSLLYQMIPRSVADRLRQGEPALNTCEVCAIIECPFVNSNVEILVLKYYM